MRILLIEDDPDTAAWLRQGLKEAGHAVDHAGDGREGLFLAAIGLAFMHDGNETALLAAFAAVIGSFLVSYTRAKAEALGLRGDVGFGSRVERVVLIAVGLFFAPWGWLQWPIYVLAALAWLTVTQRILFVRRQLRELAASS